MTPARDSGSPRAPATLALGAALILAGLAFGLDGRARLPGSRCSPWPSARSPGWSWRRSAAGWSGRRGRPGSRRAIPTRCGSACAGPWSRRREGSSAIRCSTGRSRSARAGAAAPRASIWLERPGRVALVPARLVVRDPLGLWRRGARFRAHRRARGAAADRPGPLDRPRLGAARASPPAPAASRRHLPARRPGAVRGRRPAPLPRGQPRVANPLAGGRAHRRDDRAAPDRRAASRGRWSSSIPAAPRSRDAARAGDARRRLALRRAGALAAAATCCCPGERRPLAIDPSLRSWPEAHVQDRRLRSRRRARSCRRALTGSAVLWVTAGQALPASLRRSAPGSFLITPTRLPPRGGLPGLGLLRLSGDGAGRAPRDAAQGGRMSGARRRPLGAGRAACFAALAASPRCSGPRWSPTRPPGGSSSPSLLATAAGAAHRRDRPPRALARGALAARRGRDRSPGSASGLVVVGLPARLLLPGHWDELGAERLAQPDGLTDVPVPYAGADAWTRLVILLASPLMVGAGRLRGLLADAPAGGRAGSARSSCSSALYLVAVAWARPGPAAGRRRPPRAPDLRLALASRRSRRAAAARPQHRSRSPPRWSRCPRRRLIDHRQGD